MIVVLNGWQGVSRCVLIPPSTTLHALPSLPHHSACHTVTLSHCQDALSDVKSSLTTSHAIIQLTQKELQNTQAALRERDGQLDDTRE
jgi:hypothetical protein